MARRHAGVPAGSGSFIRKARLWTAIGLVFMIVSSSLMPAGYTPAYALIAPTTLTPFDGSVVTVATDPPLGIPELTWAPVADATSYRLQISGNIGFTTLAVNITTPNTRYTPTAVSALADGVWYWRVRAEAPAPASEYSPPVSFTKQWASSGNAPTLSAPADGATQSFYDSPALSWQPSAGAAYYRVQIAATESFDSFLYNQTTLATTHQPATKLDNGTYYWRVTPVDAGGRDGTPSAARSFTLGYDYIPALLEPADNATLDFTPTFRWTAVRGAQFYRLQYSTDPSFAIAVNTKDTRNTTYTPTGGIDNDQNYYWRVAAYSGNSISDWSPVRRFFKRWYIKSELLTPVNNYQYNKDAFFSWTPVPGASRYKIEVNRISSTSFPATGSNGWSYYTPNTFYVKPHWSWESASTWYWRVTPYDRDDNPGVPSDVASFNYQAAGAPDLIYPFYYYTPTALLPTHEDRSVALPVFMWQRLFYPTDTTPVAAYRVQVDDNPLFSSSIDWTFDTANLSAVPTASAPFTPTPGGIYYWRVRPLTGIGGSEIGQWSQKWKTRIDPTLGLTPTDGSSPTLLRPVRGAEMVENAPLLEWWPLQGADSYDVEISADASFAADQQIELTNVPYPAYAPQTRLANGTYYWRVRGRTGGTPGAWSGGWRFQVAAQSRWLESRAVGELPNTDPQIGSDPAGDVAGQNYDMTTLYAGQSKDYWHFGFHAQGSVTNTTYVLYLDLDQVDGSGATSDAEFYDVQAITAHRPEYAIYLPQTAGVFDPNTIAVYRWNGSSWGWPQSLADVGGSVSYAPGSGYVEISLQGTTLQGATGGIALAVFSAPPGGGAPEPPGDETPVDSVPSDPGLSSTGVISRFTIISERLTPALPRSNATGDPNDLASAIPFFWHWPIDTPWEGFNIQVATDEAFSTVVRDYTQTANAPYLPLPTYTYSDNSDNGVELPGDNTYYWRVRPVYFANGDPKGAWSQAARFDRSGLVPENLQTSVTFATPTFTWDPVEGAESYELQVDDDPSFGSPDIKPNPYPVRSSFTHERTLAQGSYYWRVRARRKGGYSGNWSPTQSFTLSLPQPAGLAHSPAGVVNRAPTLCWTPLIAPSVGDAVLAAWKYRVQVSKGDPTFSAGSIYDGIDTEQACWTPTKGYEDATYYWRVAMIDGDGKAGGYSSAAQFTKQYPVTTLLSPASGGMNFGTPTYTWTPVNGAASYKLEISIYPTFSTLYDSVTTNNTRFTPTKSYGVGNTYYWRVAIIDKDGKIGPFNDATIIVTDPAAAFKLFLPAVLRGS